MIITKDGENNLFFIIGVARSGTSLLHYNIFVQRIIFEKHFIVVIIYKTLLGVVIKIKIR